MMIPSIKLKKRVKDEQGYLVTSQVQTQREELIIIIVAVAAVNP